MQNENNPFKNRFTLIVISENFFPPHNRWPLKPEILGFSPKGSQYSRVAQRKRAGPITKGSMDRNHPLLNGRVLNDMQNYKKILLRTALRNFYSKRSFIPFITAGENNPQFLGCESQRSMYSRVAQRKRAGPITQRSMDRNHPLLKKMFLKT